MKYDVIIIGAGAAGLMCAAQAGQHGRRVLLIDHAKAPGEKIRISGGGRCNFTNIHTSPDNFLSENPLFCVSALKRYTPFDFIDLVEKHGIAYHEKTLGQLFCDASSKQIIAMLVSECEQGNVEIRLNTTLSAIAKIKDGFSMVASGSDELQCESLVIATGGPSIPKMGATGWGYDIARQFGLDVIEPRAALVPFTLDESTLASTRSLAGVSLDAIAQSGETRFREGMLFTHRGLSGPSMLQISSYWQEGGTVQVNMAPDIDMFDRLKTAREHHPKQEVQTILAQHVPKKLASYLCEHYDISERLADCANTRLQAIADHVNQWHVQPNGTEGFRTAEVTIGGVNTDELSSKTFECKKQPGLYFIGEVVDVTGHLGGFNFQWAWASGHAAGQCV